MLTGVESAGTRAGWPRDHWPAVSACQPPRSSAIARIVPPCARISRAEVSRPASRSASRAYSHPDRSLICIMSFASAGPDMGESALVGKREQGDENGAGWHGKRRVCPLVRVRRNNAAGARQGAALRTSVAWICPKLTWLRAWLGADRLIRGSADVSQRCRRKRSTIRKLCNTPQPW